MDTRLTTIVAILLLFILIIGCSTPARFKHELEKQVTPWNHEQFDDSDEKFTFAIFSDLTGGEREHIFAVAVAQLNLLRSEMIMNVGDLIEGGVNYPAELHGQWDWFDQWADKAIAPNFYAGGNHDLTGELSR